MLNFMPFYTMGSLSDVVSMGPVGDVTVLIDNESDIFPQTFDGTTLLSAHSPQPL